MLVGVCRVALSLPGVTSLKEKRSIVRRVLERTSARFPVSAAEVADQDRHDRAVLGFALASSDGAHASAVLERVLRFVEELGVAPVIRRQTQLLRCGPFDLRRGDDVSLGGPREGWTADWSAFEEGDDAKDEEPS
ncbi:MAG: DUF503 domain-containing protein [Myxococcales bacterium]|nr:DUF503 domain-containing protein [Myxococcales bacterium]